MSADTRGWARAREHRCVPQHLRVISGTAGGRRLSAPRDDSIRPTTGRVKEAIFSALTAREQILNAHVLDLYSGTGALGIEALSRSAARGVLVENDRAAVEILKRNLSVTGTASAARVVAADVGAFLAGSPPDEAPFGLVLCDPPYDVDSPALDKVLAPLGTRAWTIEETIVVVERPVGVAAPNVEGLRISWERKFGDTLVFFLST
jgi:16S rRNA (guanine966-N2)-methyltransferase